MRKKYKMKLQDRWTVLMNEHMEQLNTSSRWSVSCYFFGENGYERGKILSVTGINLCHDNTEDTEIIT